ncbi:MAG: isochorismatase [Gemmatimonadota bacterium]
MIGPYTPRPITPVGLWAVDGWRLKAYSITLPGAPLAADLEAGARAAAELLLRAGTEHETYGVGFVGIHQGRGFNQVFIDRWANRNELLHDVFVSDERRPGELRPAPPGHNSVCLWDLALQTFERDAWIATAMAHGGLEAYLARVLDAEV